MMFFGWIFSVSTSLCFCAAGIFEKTLFAESVVVDAASPDSAGLYLLQAAHNKGTPAYCKLSFNLPILLSSLCHHRCSDSFSCLPLFLVLMRLLTM